MTNKSTDNMPINTVAEKYIVGSLILEPRNIPDFTQEDFYITSYRNVFNTILKLNKDKSPIDVFTIADNSNISLEDITGLSNQVATLQNYEHHKKTLKEASEARRILNLCRIVSEEISSSNIEDIQARKKTLIDNLKAEKSSKNEEQYVLTYMKDFLDSIMNDSYRAKPISTGYLKLNKMLGGGLYAGLYAIGGISSLGKTSLILQVGDYIARNGTDVIFFSLEMSKLELVAKSLSREIFDRAKDKTKIRGIGTREILNGEVKDILPELGVCVVMEQKIVTISHKL